MKLLIVALNSKYTHTSLSVRCIHGAVKDICDSSFVEYTINDNQESVVADIFARKPDCIAFSCYIWNIENVLKIASVIKKASPGTTIVLGGHEVEHDSESILNEYKYIDAVLRGEGEISMREYVKCFLGEKDISSAFSITYRKDDEIVYLPDAKTFVDLNEVPFVYDDSIDEIKNKVIYYETSRGCPYNCTYCLSGEGHKVRFLDVERVKKEFDFFIKKRVPLVKLVDRTFNADIKRAKEIFEFVAQNPGDTCFHMELSGDIIDDETIEILSKVKKGTLQFEIGVQTTNPETTKAINRKVSFDKLKTVVTRLMSKDNIHIHLDLIAGLPYEDLTSFKNSFNEVIAIKPHVLQLGFLKMLKGSYIRGQQHDFGYEFKDFAPYEIIKNDFISFEELLELKITENALDRFYNSGYFKNTMEYLMSKTKDYYGIFHKIGLYMSMEYPTGYAFSKQLLFDIIYECFGKDDDVFVEKLKKDYLISFRPGARPCWMGEHNDEYTKIAYEMFKDEELKKEHYPFYYDVPAKEIMKHIYAEKFKDSVLLFDHYRNAVYDITEYCSR